MTIHVRVDPSFSLREIFQSLINDTPASPSIDKLASPEQLHESIGDVEEWLKIKLRTGKCSHLLIAQLARHNLRLGQVFGGSTYYFIPYDIYTEIERLESEPRPDRIPFQRQLRGLYHVHHNRTTFILENAIRRCDQRARNSGKSETDFLQELADSAFANLLRRGLPADQAVQRTLQYVAYQELIDAFDGTFDKTGEWLVYAVHKDVNYFLTLAFHKEPPQEIWTRVATCIDEFPFLIGVLPVGSRPSEPDDNTMT